MALFDRKLVNSADFLSPVPNAHVQAQCSLLPPNFVRNPRCLRVPQFPCNALSASFFVHVSNTLTPACLPHRQFSPTVMKREKLDELNCFCPVSTTPHHFSPMHVLSIPNPRHTSLPYFPRISLPLSPTQLPSCIAVSPASLHRATAKKREISVQNSHSQ